MRNVGTKVFAFSTTSYLANYNLYKQKLKTKMWKAEQVVICPQPSVLVLLDPGQERAILSQMTTFSMGCSEKGDFEKCNLTSQ